MSTISNIGIPLPNGQGVSGILHPKQKNRWRVRFAGFGNGTSSDSVTAQAVKVGRPKVKFNKVDLHRYNSISFVAGKHTYEPLELVVEDDTLNTVSTVIQAQLQKQQWLIGAEGQWLAAAEDGATYKFSMYIEQLNGNDKVTEQWVVEGCWIVESDYDSLDYAEDKQVLITMSVSFDNAQQLFLSTGTGATGLATGGVAGAVTTG